MLPAPRVGPKAPFFLAPSWLEVLKPGIEHNGQEWSILGLADDHKAEAEPAGSAKPGGDLAL